MNPLLLILFAFAGWREHVVEIEGKAFTVWSHSSGLVVYDQGATE